MKLYAPSYYKKFACIADRCRHSCCIGWEIDVDAATMEKYAAVTEEYGQTVRESIVAEEEPHFALDECERCPHLDGRGLCKIITALGEGYLCDICREHPRFYNDTPYGKEVGLGMACEEACRLILSSDGYALMEEVGETEGEIYVTDFDAPFLRQQIYDILLMSSLQYEEKLALLARKYAAPVACLSDEQWKVCLSSLEYLDEAHRTLFASYSSMPDTPEACVKMCERALAYFIYRHGTAAEDEQDFRVRLVLAFFLERLLASIVRAERLIAAKDIEEIARIISEEIEYSEDNVDTLLFAIESHF